MPRTASAPSSTAAAQTLHPVSPAPCTRPNINTASTTAASTRQQRPLRSRRESTPRRSTRIKTHATLPTATDTTIPLSQATGHRATILPECHYRQRQARQHQCATVLANRATSMTGPTVRAARASHPARHRETGTRARAERITRHDPQHTRSDVAQPRQFREIPSGNNVVTMQKTPVLNELPRLPQRETDVRASTRRAPRARSASAARLDDGVLTNSLR